MTGGEPFGIATIWDFDIMLWLFGQVRLMMKDGEPPSRYIGFHVHECLIGVRRHTGKTDYQQLEAALTGCEHAHIHEHRERQRGRQRGRLAGQREVPPAPFGRLDYVEVWINEWIFQKVIDQAQILTLHPNYFLLTGGIEKFLYRTARKMAGRQPQGWTLDMDDLFKRSGADNFKHFVAQVRRVADNNDHPIEALPEYRLLINRKGDGRKFTESVTFLPREYNAPKANKKPLERGASDHRYYGGYLALSDDARDEAKAFCRANDLDYQTFYEQWKAKQMNGKAQPVKSPGRAFMGYLQGVVKRQSNGK